MTRIVFRPVGSDVALPGFVQKAGAPLLVYKVLVKRFGVEAKPLNPKPKRFNPLSLNGAGWGGHVSVPVSAGLAQSCIHLGSLSGFSMILTRALGFRI